MDKKQARIRRGRRARAKIRELGAHRLTIHRTSQHIYAQIIDDTQGTTLVSASTQDKEYKDAPVDGKKRDIAKAVGTLVGKRAVDKGIKKVVFDRNGFLYHGRIKALSDGAREAGLEF